MINDVANVTGNMDIIKIDHKRRNNEIKIIHCLIMSQSVSFKNLEFKYYLFSELIRISVSLVHINFIEDLNFRISINLP